MLISQRAFDFIVDQETGGQAEYAKLYVHTDWPGGESGVTIGCGYDLGYETSGTIAIDWHDKVRADMLVALQDCAGVHGRPARALAHELIGRVTIPWAMALAVFTNRDVPKWTKAVQTALPNTDKLSGDSLGALVSLAFNRGASFSEPGPRYSEMRLIRAYMEDENFAAIPFEIRSMKRIWPNSSDLRNRREAEAKLFQEGLTVIA